ncbi:hypothetical protein C0J52_12826 [Blattella germanica]|nr:hypothetical protein C0J52_12826 [Blattella germanica]
MEVGKARGETSIREMGARSYNVGSIPGREDEDGQDADGRHNVFIAGAGKHWSRLARDRKMWKELEKSCR